MGQLWSQTPGPEVVVETRLGHEEGECHRSHGNRDKEDGLVSEHYGVHHEDHQGGKEAEGMEKTSPSKKTLLEARLERSCSERRGRQVPSQQQDEDDRVWRKFYHQL